ncbi:hypothetical protein PR202_gb22711 [Eleusine coracana subsp. coracana]|uniref:Uncharacterized protein n=1 Tax=Eleusine coracana subsp. coracana TaxID=191504 RepID=A0AAV5FEC8_ELECO|nr:hypothetical protein PR202_gb22711 [Eleusine coracana subsp. coracana]
METGGGGETVEVATCACCGIGEECTARYVAGVAAQFGGTWVCGLCAEAIKDEASGLRWPRERTPSSSPVLAPTRPSKWRGRCSSCSRG